VTVYGESFIEHGIPADTMVDEWSVAFDRFAVAVNDVQVAATDVHVVSPVELTADSAGHGHEIGRATVATGQYKDVQFAVDEVNVKGIARRDDMTKTFAWRFEQKVRYYACDTTTTIESGGDTKLQITIHADHLFYDSLVAQEPKLGFQALADADVDGDGEVTMAELSATDIGAYDPGSEDGLDDLWSWLSAQVRTLGHVNGEGHCQTCCGAPSDAL